MLATHGRSVIFKKGARVALLCLVMVLYLMLPLRPRGKKSPLPVLEPAVTMDSTCAHRAPHGSGRHSWLGKDARQGYS